MENRTQRRASHLSLLIFAGVLLIYVSLRTTNYYWDGIALAYDIEHSNSRPLLHPNHLLYGPLGYALWNAARGAFPNLRALDVLQVCNCLFAAGAVALFYCIAASIFESTYLAVCLALAFAFSATWWKFSTDADSYVPALFFMTLGLWLVMSRSKPRPILLGCIHAAGMLFHELAALFTPVLMAGLWYQYGYRTAKQRVAALLQYVVAAGAITTMVYAAAYVRHFGSFEVAGLLRWVTSSSEDASFSLRIGENLLASIGGLARLFWGGRIPLVRSAWDPVIVFTSAILIVLIAGFLVLARNGMNLSIERRYRGVAYISLLWVLIYSGFLLFWLPHNTFYRLFYLPPLILLFGTMVSGQERRRCRLALAVAILFFWNLGFHIYPYALAKTNSTLQIARTLQNVWPAGTIVYWDVYSADNRTIQYFNPQVEWRELWDRAWIEDVGQTMKRAYESGKGVWFDLGALRRFVAADAEFRTWLETHCELGNSREFTESGSRIGFVQLVPKRP